LPLTENQKPAPPGERMTESNKKRTSGNDRNILLVVGQTREKKFH